MNNRTPTIKSLTVSTAGGTDPDVIEGVDGIDDNNAVGDFPEVFELCLKSPVGQCQYEAADGFRRCIHCRKGDGVC